MCEGSRGCVTSWLAAGNLPFADAVLAGSPSASGKRKRRKRRKRKKRQKRQKRQKRKKRDGARTVGLSERIDITYSSRR
jgi:hypothetical protein